jgi:vacuolar-type H+-ATPase subunit E/Vma4
LIYTPPSGLENKSFLSKQKHTVLLRFLIAALIKGESLKLLVFLNKTGGFGIASTRIREDAKKNDFAKNDSVNGGFQLLKT